MEFSACQTPCTIHRHTVSLQLVVWADMAHSSCASSPHIQQVYLQQGCPSSQQQAMPPFPRALCPH